MLIVVAGPSGVGKSRLLRLAESGLGWGTVTPWTSRPRRDDEEPGRDYSFCTQDEFRARIEAGDMPFWDFTLRHYYGYGPDLTERAASGQPHIIQALARLGLRLVQAVPDSATVFLHASDEHTLRARLNARGYDRTELVLREQHWLEERTHAPMFDVQVSEAELADTDAMLALLSELAGSLK